MRQVAISGSGGKLRAAWLQEGRLREYRTESEGTEVHAGDFFSGRVADVLPGIQSAFVDIGSGQNAYLYVDDAVPRSGAAGKPNISERVQVGEKVIVQVSKEATEMKAPKVTTRVSLQGRYLVYLPLEAGVSVSRKITDGTVRQHLIETLTAWLSPGEGAIVRTEAADAAQGRLSEELAYLKKRWKDTQARAEKLPHPGFVSRDLTMLESVIRDLLAQGVEEVLVEHGPTFQAAKEVMQIFAGEGMDKLRLYQGTEPLFAHLGIEAQLQYALQRQVPLKSGGHLVIDRTEAMTVIDVNTGAFTGKGGQQREQAITQANLEAAAEIALQLRLRDIGGIIIIDFIDMKEAANKERVLAALKRELARDPVPSTVLGITALGLVEMTRKRVRASLAERLTEPCDACDGCGRVWSVDELQHQLWQEVSSLAKGQEAEAVLLELPERLYRVMSEMDGDQLKKWPARLFLRSSSERGADQYRILYAGRQEEAARLYGKQS
ncbi:Rne/Rng family ribonuclease [Brevibacillus choshinensis]|uniref:Rne/Rng family ribonuclease n=1 Tax=Brevibacillus choshinensis TaxID=54911 RepID=A0ABX7FT51_BRECH|nr:Rne/Rng family ribonuclease [Brevibacillus choshinensis]QRG69408.1 Rne/Rng family ribonuclease [Brevibacillus choshinensis]